VTQTVNSHGRVDEDNNVYVFDNGSERKVGQYPGVSMEEALAYFERKFAELEGNVRILEQRVKGKADAASISKAAQKLSSDLAEPAAVGNIQELRERVASITPSIEQMKKDKSEASEKAVAQTLATRRDIAAKAQALADKDPKKTQWKAASAQMNELFEKWQQSQKNAPKISRKDSEPIWKSFSQARTKFEANKRAFFSALSAESKTVRAKKTALVAQAEALVAKGADSAAEYRKLLDQWKLAGRSQGTQDDQLWDRFKAAGDSIYAVRKEVIAKESVEFKANFEAKLQIIADAEKLDPMRAVEKRIKDAEQENWRKSDPAAIERTSGVLSQLEQSIAKLEKELQAAELAGDSAKIQQAKDALEARRSWLTVVKQNQN
jgi:hypothetical protein